VIEKPVGVDILKKAREIYQKRETALERYIDQVLIWNQKINIMSRNVSRETIREHIVHSLLPVPLGWIDLHSCWVDAGTGGGLPGIPLAIQTPGTRWILNDNVRKKIRVVEAIISECGLRNT
jgi:16S rRNA (guanine527-N7)-methyltransferase